MPESYLQFIIATNQNTIDAFQAELDRRSRAAEASLSWAQKIIEAGFRELVKKHHPDVNNGSGSAETREILATVDKLRELVRE